MKERTLQILRYLAMPCVFGCSLLSADDMNDSSGMSSSSDKGHFVSTYERVKGKEITPEAGVVVTGGVDVYVMADYIFWHVSEGGLAYALNGGDTAIASTPTSNNTLSQGHVVTPNFKMSSGFKAGLGLDFHYDGWDMGLVYTWMHTHASSSFGAAPVGAQNVALLATSPLVLPSSHTTEVVATATTPTSGSGLWRLHFNVLDLELGRSYFISPKLVMRPHFGLKGTWQTQRYTVRYSQTGSTLALPGLTLAATDVENYRSYHKQNYWGIGPRAGLNTSWMVSKNFSFFGNWALAALWGQFKDTRSDMSSLASGTGTALVTNYNTVNARARAHQLSPVFELELGLRYDYWFCDDEYRFRLAASWENQMWLNQNHFVTYASNYEHGDLSLQGLTINVRFDF